MFEHVQGELNANLPALKRVFSTDNTSYDLPVAFATNSMFLFARHGMVDQEVFENRLLPLFKQKAAYLHNEGVAHAAWALSRAEIWDAEAWSIIKEAALERDFALNVVKTKRWNLFEYSAATPTDHILQSGLSEYANQYYYEDRSALYDLHDGLVRAHSKNSSLGLDQVLQEFERKYP